MRDNFIDVNLILKSDSGDRVSYAVGARFQV